jgi:hypothetical protein
MLSSSDASEPGIGDSAPRCPPEDVWREDGRRGGLSCGSWKIGMLVTSYRAKRHRSISIRQYDEKWEAYGAVTNAEH